MVCLYGSSGTQGCRIFCCGAVLYPEGCLAAPWPLLSRIDDANSTHMPIPCNSSVTNAFRAAKGQSHLWDMRNCTRVEVSQWQASTRLEVSQWQASSLWGRVCRVLYPGQPGKAGRELKCFLVILLLNYWLTSETPALFILLTQWPLRESHPPHLPQHMAQHFLTLVLNELLCHAAVPGLA